MNRKLRVILFFIVILLAGALLLKSNPADFFHFLIWWLCFMVMGVLFLPITDLAFGCFKNGGYMFSKTLCLAATGYLQWLLTSLHILPFRTWSCFLVILPFVGINILVNRKTGTWQRYIRDDALFLSVGKQEAIFMALFLFWAYLRALRPDIEGIEKFMNFGFINSMLRNDWLPAPDMWLSGMNINYYYLGHFFTAYLTRLTFIDPAVTYNLMMATLFALSFMLAYSIAEFLIELYQKNRTNRNPGKKGSIAGVIAGVFAGLSVCVAGNLHSIIFGVLFKKWNVGNTYWFPSATRYIGYNPEVLNDKTISEFPIYSFVISDLHAHVSNIPFVLTVIALAVTLAASILKRRTEVEAEVGTEVETENDVSADGVIEDGVSESGVSENGVSNDVGTEDDSVSLPDNPTQSDPDPGNPRDARVCVPYIVRSSSRFARYLAGKDLRLGTLSCFTLIIFLVGLFPSINFWDYPIYIVFTGAMLLYANLKVYNYTLKSLLATARQVAAVGAAAYMVMLPFHLSFDSMGIQIRFAQTRSMLYQLGVLWGWQLFFAAVLTYIMIYQYRKQSKDSRVGHDTTDDTSLRPADNQARVSLFRFMDRVNPGDALVFAIFICAVGLFVIPELIYVADIYPSHPRANTMFKLGFQAFIMFGIGVGYTLTRLIFEAKARIKFKWPLLAVGSILLAAALVYPVFAVHQWYGNILTKPYKGLDGTKYMLTEGKWHTGADSKSVPLLLKDDYELIRYINENIDGSPVIAEAFGDPFTLSGRVSAYTGLPSILNWYDHQLLWRNSDYEMLDERRDDINALYESGDLSRVREIIAKYDVSYIVLGEIERLRYPDLDEELLISMGNTVSLWNDNYDTYLISIAY